MVDFKTDFRKLLKTKITVRKMNKEFWIMNYDFVVNKLENILYGQCFTSYTSILSQGKFLKGHMV